MEDFSKFVKYDAGKPRFELLDPFVMEEIVKVLTYGAKKYNDHNWNKCTSLTRYFGAACRHLFAWLKGEDYDQESGCLHLAHCICCCMFIIGIWNINKEADDRIKHG